MSNKTKSNPKGAGAKRKELDDKDWIILETAILFGDKKYCADKLKISDDTLNTRIRERHGVNFSVYKQQKRAEIENNLHLKQYEIAMKGNVPMLIWLGKNILGQKDKQETELTGKDGKALEIKFIK